MIERQHLQIVREIDRCGSLTEAADQLFLTQSALSHAMKKLQQQLGVALWHKQGRKLQFTPAGNELLKLARRLLPQLEHSEQRLQAMGRGEQGQLRIGMECHPCYRWLLTVVEPFLARWPKVDVDVKQQFQFGGMAGLFAHDIDVLVTPDPIERKGLSFTPVFHYEQVLVVAKAHPLAGLSHVTPTRLNGEVLFTYPVEEARLDVFSGFLLPANCRPKLHKTIEDSDIMLQLVAANRGVASLPRWMVEQSAQQGIEEVPLGEQGLYKQIYLGIRSEDAQLDYVRDFIEQASL